MTKHIITIALIAALAACSGANVPSGSNDPRKGGGVGAGLTAGRVAGR